MQLAIFLCRVLFATRWTAAGPLLEEDASSAAAAADGVAAAAAVSPLTAATGAFVAAATPDELLRAIALSTPSSNSSASPSSAGAELLGVSAAASPASDAAAVAAEYRDLLLRRVVTVAAAAEDIWLLHLALWLAGQHAAALFALLPPQQHCSPVPLSAALAGAAPPASAAAPAAMCAAPALAPAACSAAVCAGAPAAHLAAPLSLQPLHAAFRSQVYFACSQVALHPAQQEAAASTARFSTTAAAGGGGGGAAAPGPQPQQHARAAAETSLPTERGGAPATRTPHCLHTSLQPSTLSAAVVPYLSVLLSSRPLRHLAAHLQTALPLLHQLLRQRRQQISLQQQPQQEPKQQHAPPPRKHRSRHEPRQQQQQLTSKQNHAEHLDDQQQPHMQRHTVREGQRTLELPLQRQESRREHAQQKEGLLAERGGAAAATSNSSASAEVEHNILLKKEMLPTAEPSLSALQVDLAAAKENSATQQTSATGGEGAGRGIEPAPEASAGTAGAALAALLGQEQATAATAAEEGRLESNQERQHGAPAAGSFAGVTEAVVVGETCQWALANPTAVAAGEHYLMSVTYTRSGQPLLAALAAISFLSLASAGAFHSRDAVLLETGASSCHDAVDCTSNTPSGDFTSSSPFPATKSSRGFNRSGFSSSGFSSSGFSSGAAISSNNREGSNKWGEEDDTAGSWKDAFAARGGSRPFSAKTVFPACSGVSNYLSSSSLLLALPTVCAVFRSLFSSWVAEPGCCHSAASSLLGSAAAEHSSKRYQALLQSRFPVRHAQQQMQCTGPLWDHRAARDSWGDADGVAAPVVVSTAAAAAPSVVTVLTGLNTGAFLLLPCSPFAVAAAAAAAAGATGHAASLPLAMSFSLAYCVGSLVGSPFLLLPAFDAAAAAASSVSFAAARRSFAREATAAAAAAAVGGGAAAASEPAPEGVKHSSREGKRTTGVLPQSERVAVLAIVPAADDTSAAAQAPGEKDAAETGSNAEMFSSSAVLSLRGLAVLEAVAAQLLLEEGDHWHVLCHCCDSGRRSSGSYSPAKRLLRLLQDAESCGGGARRIARAAAETVVRSVIEATATAALRQQLLRQASQQQQQQFPEEETAAAAPGGDLGDAAAASYQKQVDGASQGRQQRQTAEGGADDGAPCEAQQQLEANAVPAAVFAIKAAAAAGQGTYPLSFLFRETEHVAACVFWAALRAAALARRSMSRSQGHLLHRSLRIAATGEDATAKGSFDYWEWRSMRAAWKLGRLSAASWRRQLLLLDCSVSNNGMARLSGTYPLPDSHLSLTGARHIFLAGAAAAAAAATAEAAEGRRGSSAGPDGSRRRNGRSAMETNTSSAATAGEATRGAACPADSSGDGRATGDSGAGEGGAARAGQDSFASSERPGSTRRRRAGQGGAARLVASALEYYAALQVLLQELLRVFDRPEQQIFSPASLLCCCAALIKVSLFTSAAAGGKTDQQDDGSPSSLRSSGWNSSSKSSPLSPTARQRRFFLLHSGGADLTLLQLRQLAALVLAAIAAAVVCFAAAFPTVPLVFLVPRPAASLHDDSAAGCRRIAGLSPRSSSTVSSSTATSSTTSSSTSVQHNAKKDASSVVAAKERRSVVTLDDADATSAVGTVNNCMLSTSLACGVAGDPTILSPLANVLRLVVGIQLLLQQPERTDWLQQLLAYLWLAIFSLSASSCSSSSRGGSTSNSSAKRRVKTTGASVATSRVQSTDDTPAAAAATAAAVRTAASAEVDGKRSTKRAEKGLSVDASQRENTERDASPDSVTKRRAMRCLAACMVVKAFEFFLDVLHTLQGEMLRSLHVLHLLRASRVYWQQHLRTCELRARQEQRPWLPRSSRSAAAVQRLGDGQEQQPRQKPQVEADQWQQQQRQRQKQDAEEPAICCCDDSAYSYTTATGEIAVLRGWLGQLCYSLSGFLCTHLRPQLTGAAPAAAPVLLPLLCLSRTSEHEQVQHGGGDGSSPFLARLLQRFRTSPSPRGKCTCGADNAFLGSSAAASAALLCDEEVLHALFGSAAAARLWLLLGCTRRLRWLYSQLPFLPVPQPALPSSLGAAASSAAALCARELQQKIKEESHKSSTLLAADRLAFRTSTRRHGEAEAATGAPSGQQQHQQPTAQRQTQPSGQHSMNAPQPHTETSAAASERARCSSEKAAPEHQGAPSADQCATSEQLLQQQLAQAGVSMLLLERSGAAGGGTQQRSGRRKGDTTTPAAGGGGASKGNVPSGYLTVQQQRAAASLPTVKAAEDLMEKTGGRPAVPCVLAGIFPPEKVKYVAASKATNNGLETLGKLPGMRFPSVTSPAALLQLLWKQRSNRVPLPHTASTRPFWQDADRCHSLLNDSLLLPIPSAGGCRFVPQTPWWSCLRCSVPIAAVWGPVTRACCSSRHRRCRSVPAAAAATSSDIVFGIGPLSGSGASSYALRTVRVPNALVGEGAAAAGPSTCTAALLYSAAAAVHATAAAAAAAAAEQAEVLSDDVSNAGRKPRHSPAAALEMEAWSRLSASGSMSLVKEAGGSGGAFIGVAAVRRATVNSAPELQRELLFCEQLQQQVQAAQQQPWRQLHGRGGAAATGGTASLAAWCAAGGDWEEGRGWSSSSREHRERATAQVIASGIEESSCVLSIWFGCVLARDAALYSYVQVNRMGSAMRMLAGATSSAVAAAAAVRVQQEERDQRRLSAGVKALQQQPVQPALPLISSSVVLRRTLPLPGSAANPVSQHATSAASVEAAVGDTHSATGSLQGPDAAASTTPSPPAAPARPAPAASGGGHRGTREQVAGDSPAVPQTAQQRRLPPAHLGAASGSVTPLFPYQAFASLSVLRSTFCFAGAMREHPSLPVFSAALYRLQASTPSQKAGEAFSARASPLCFALILRPYGAHARALPRAAAAISLPVVSPRAAAAASTSGSAAAAAGRRSAQKSVMFADTPRAGQEGEDAACPDRSRSAPATTDAAGGDVKAVGDTGDHKLTEADGTVTTQRELSLPQENIDLRQRRTAPSKISGRTAAAASLTQAAQEQHTAQQRDEQDTQTSPSVEYASKSSTSFFYPSSAAKADGVEEGSAKPGMSSGSKRRFATERSAGSTARGAKGSSGGSAAAVSSSLWGISSTQRPASSKSATATASARPACGKQVTVAVWNDHGDQLFVADTSGWVYLYTILRGPLLPPTAAAAVAAAATAAATAEAAAAGRSSKEEKDHAGAVSEKESAFGALEQLLRPAVAWRAHHGPVQDALVLNSSGTWLLTRGRGVPPHALRQNPLLVEGDPSTSAPAERSAGRRKSHSHSPAEEETEQPVDDHLFDGWHFFDRLRAAEEDSLTHFAAASDAASRAHNRAAVGSSTIHGRRESLLLRRARPVLLRGRARRAHPGPEVTGSSSSVCSGQEDDSDGSSKALSSRVATPRSDRSRAGLPASFEQRGRPRLSTSRHASPPAGGKAGHGRASTEAAKLNRRAEGTAGEKISGQSGHFSLEGTGGESSVEERELRRQPQLVQSHGRLGVSTCAPPFTHGLTLNRECVCFPQLVQEQESLPCCRDRPDLLTKLHARLLRRLRQEKHRAAARDRGKGEEESRAAAAAGGESAEDRNSGAGGEAWRGAALPLQQWASGLLSLTSGFPASGGSDRSCSGAGSTTSTSRSLAERDRKKEPAFLEWAREAMSSAAAPVPPTRNDDSAPADDSVGSYILLEEDEQQELALMGGTVARSCCYRQRGRKHFPSIDGECICLWDVWDVSEGGGPRLDCVFTCDDELLVRVRQLFFPATSWRSISPLQASEREAGETDSPKTSAGRQLTGHASRSHSRSSSVARATRHSRSGAVSASGRAAAAAATAEEFFGNFTPNFAGEESDQDGHNGNSTTEWVVTPTHIPSCVTVGVLQNAVTSCSCWRCSNASAPMCDCCGSISCEASGCCTACFPSQSPRRAAFWRESATRGRSVGGEEHDVFGSNNTSRRCILYGDTAGWVHAVDLRHREEVCRWKAHPSCVVSCAVSCMAAAIPCADRFNASIFPASWLITGSAAPAADATVRCWSLSALRGGLPFLLFEFNSPAHIPLPLRSTPSETAAAAAAAAAAAGVAARHRLAAAGEAATVLAAAAVEAMQLGFGGSDNSTSPGVVVCAYPHRERNPAAATCQSPAAAAAAVVRSQKLVSSSPAPTGSPLIRLLGGGGNERELGGGGLQRELQQAAEETALVRLDIVGPYCVVTVRKDGVVVLNRL